MNLLLVLRGLWLVGIGLGVGVGGLTPTLDLRSWWSLILDDKGLLPRRGPLVDSCLQQLRLQSEQYHPSPFR